MLIQGEASSQCPHHEANHDDGQHDDQAEEYIDLFAMLFCGPNFRKAAIFAPVNTAGPHGVHAAQLVFFHVFGTALRTHAGVLHGDNMSNSVI